MNILDTRAYRWAQIATDFFLLNLLWLLASVLIVTAFPATAAMFSVVRDWVRGKEGGVFRAFVFRFRQNFWQSLVVGAVWTVFAGALLLDFFITREFSGGVQVVMRSLLVLAGVLFALSSVFLFPVMVHYDTKWTAVPKNALLLSIGRLPTTLACLVTVAAAAMLTFIVPLLLLVTPSLTAHAVYRLCDREFRKIDGQV